MGDVFKVRLLDMSQIQSVQHSETKVFLKIQSGVES